MAQVERARLQSPSDKTGGKWRLSIGQDVRDFDRSDFPDEVRKLGEQGWKLSTEETIGPVGPFRAGDRLPDLWWVELVFERPG